VALTAPLRQPDPKIRVMVVDDSAVIRGLVSRWLEAEPQFEVVGSCVDGMDAVKRAPDMRPDVIVLDIEMPRMDGLTALPKLLDAAPGARIIMASTLTQRGAEVTIKALSLGAMDYIAKPDAGKLAGAADYKRLLIDKLAALGMPRARSRAAETGRAPVVAAPQRAAAPVPAAPRPPIRLARAVAQRPELLVIGSSTGGPQALREVVCGLAGKVQTPVLIVQHMPAMFTAILADHLAKASRADVREAKDGDVLAPGAFLIAPGDHHMVIEERAGRRFVTLNQSPPINFCRPAVDPLFQSAARITGGRVLGCVLTGMGSDGRSGADAIVKAGGAVIVQDEPTSIVWGMPGAVANAGLAASIKPLRDIAPALLDILKGNAP
jgi:two-component system, chemotaxis family, protein-glutamate methylesterase/glutaminase